MKFKITKDEVKEIYTLYSKQRDAFVCTSPFAFKKMVKPLENKFKHYKINYHSLFFANIFLTSFIHANSLKKFLKLIEFIKKNLNSKTSMDIFSKDHQFFNKPYISQFDHALNAEDLMIILSLYHAK